MVDEKLFDEILGQDTVISPNKKREVIYYRPKFHRRVLANLIDIIIFAFIFSSLFVLNRFIVSQTNDFKQNTETLNNIKLSSGIYALDDNDQISDIVTILNNDTGQNNQYKKIKASQGIDTFLSYAKDVCEEQDYLEIKQNYDDFRMSDSLVYTYEDSSLNGTPLFVLDSENNIVENPVLFTPNPAPTIYYYYYSNVYAKYIDNNVQGYLITKIPHYYNLMKYFSYMVIFADLLPAYLVSGILVFYIPTLCFRRNRYTLGKALYRIGLVDRRVLSPSFGRITARFAIFYFAELCLSIFTFGLPYLLSFSLMVFSKDKQGFPDYMLGLIEVDTSRTKIYKNYDEADLEHIDTHKDPVDFKVPNFD